MNPYIEKLKTFLETKPPVLKFDDANTILDLLGYYYCVSNSVDNAIIHCQFRSLYDTLPKLTLEEFDAVFAITADLCLSYEKQAFMDGVLVGMQLFKELNGLPEINNVS